jgi:FdhD protein
LNTQRPDLLGKGSQQRSVTEQSSDELSSDTVDHIATEVPVAISYNGISHAVMMASPLNLQDFAVGFSLTERIIDTPAQIKAIEINKAKLGYTVQLQIDVSLMDRLDQQKRQMSGRSGCGICGISELAAAIPNLEPLKGSHKPEHSTIAKAIESFQANQSLQRECGAVHCAALFDSSGQLIALREDIGRHNALDKVIGALQSDDSRGIQDDDFLLISSRASHELITKTVIAGIGSLIAISAATTLAIDMAEKLHLNLVGFVRGNRQVVYYQN